MTSLRLAGALRCSLLSLGLLVFVRPAAATPWTATTTDAWVSQAIRRAELAEPDALARLVLAVSQHDRAAAGEVRRQLLTLSAAPAAVADQAKWLAASLQPEGRALRPLAVDTRFRTDALADPDGLVRHFALLGPFENTGGGLFRREGPETTGHSYLSADYSWGAYQVRYRRAQPQTADARGLPLDLYTYPRQESCTYLSSAVTIAAASEPAVTVLLHAASTGSFRLQVDGLDVVSDAANHRRMLVDRRQLRLSLEPGLHLLTLKNCSSAQSDDGRVRLRFTDEQYRPYPVASSSDLQQLQSLAEKLGLPVDGPSGTAGQRLHAQPVPSLLERGLQVSATASAEQLLVAALLRTLGGAEDMQSPRAPGLLDRLVRHAQLRTDQLSIAGLIAPALANRSGWLQQAYERAMATGDEASAAVAQRALVQSHLQSGQVDLAYTTAGKPPLAKAADAHAQWLKALCLARLGGSGLQRRALRQLRAISRENQHATPTAVYRTMARWSEFDAPSSFLLAMRRLAAHEPEQRTSRFVKAHGLRGAFALQRAAARALPWQRDSQQLTAIGRLLETAGRYRAAHHSYELAAAFNPNRAEAFRGLARVGFTLATDGEAAQAAWRALGRAKALLPHNAALNAELEFRRATVQPSDAKAAQLDDRRYLVAPEVFLARRTRPVADPQTQAARQLHWQRVVVFHPDKRVSQLIHYAREIVVVPRTEAERYEPLPFDDSTVELVLARVHRPDGSVLAPEQRDTPEGAAPSLRWPRLQRGDVVEVALRVWTPGPVRRRGEAPFFFVDYAGSLATYPLLYNEVVIDSPLDDPLAFDVIGGKPDRQLVSEHAGRRTTRLIFDHPVTIADEPYAPRSSELVPIVVGSPFNDWSAFLRWYQGAVAGFSQPDAQIQRLAAELTRPRAGRPLTREQKIENLFNFVADDIRYVKYVSGEWWLPNRPQHLLARRQGDCDDKAILLISLLKASGIEAREVLLQTRYTGEPAVLAAKHAAIPLFDHGIVYLPPAGAGQPGRWLDATSPQSRLGTLPAMDVSAQALVLPSSDAQAPSDTAIVTTPGATAADHGVSARWRLQLAADGSGRLTADELHVGDAAFLLRTQLLEPDARAPWIEQQLLSRWFPTLRVDPSVSFDGQLEHGAARLQYAAQSRSLARREGDELVVVIAPDTPLTARLAPLPKRTLPVVLPPLLAPRHHDLDVRIVAPAGYELADLPPDATEDGRQFGRATVSFELTKSGALNGRAEVRVKRRIAYERAQIPVAQYTSWRAWLQRVDRLLRRGVRLRPRRR